MLLGNNMTSFLFFLFQYFVFDFHMAPVMLFDKIITLSVSPWVYSFIIISVA